VHARDFSTLPEMIAYHARARPRQEVVTFGGTGTSYGDLWRAIESFAGHLLASGFEPRDRVVLALPNGPGFFVGFYGAQRAGGIAVPVAPESGVGRIADLAALCDATVVLIAEDLDPECARTLADLVAPARRRLLTLGEGLGSGPAPEVEVNADDIAFLQYTSGSTGDPKGVMLSHHGLLTNMDQMIAGMGITEEDSFVSWLPVHHDMGLILMTMVPMLLARPMVLMPTSVRSIRRWMATIAEHEATFTAAPDFAYRLAVRYLRHGERPDLSRLRVALNAAEPVRAGTVADFERTFGLGHVMAPAYGLAEATVGVSMWGPGEGLEVDGRGCVSVGRPFPDIRVRIENEEGVVATGKLGEIVVSSPANTRGYWNNDAATRALLTEDGAIRTGDLGYLDRYGNLFMVSRIKNIIIQSGRNIAPSEVEEEVEGLGFVRRAAAVGIDRGGPEGEQMWVFVEPRGEDAKASEDYDEMVIDVVAAVHGRLGMRPARVYLVEPRSIPMTPNGKLKHAALRASYLDGSLRASGQILHPPY
jgi:acyl-CoA synthetase (AMP-forming)/AMP-acid ligase II